MGADAKIQELKLELPKAPKPVATYKTALRVGNMLYVSGHGPLKADGTMIVNPGGDVATNGRVSLNQLLSTLQTIIGTSVTPAYGPSRAGDVRDSQADIAKAARLLGYAPSVPFDEGLRRTVAWALGR